MDDWDLTLRRTTYAMFVDLGRAPAVAEVATELGTTVTEALAGWRRLHDAHALVLHGNGEELRMANPFSASPTAHRVRARGRWWYANCAWDAIGICAALGSDGDIHTSCPDCGDTIELTIRDQRPDDETLLFHCLVPAASWWEDIGFT